MMSTTTQKTITKATPIVAAASDVVIAGGTAVAALRVRHALLSAGSRRKARVRWRVVYSPAPAVATSGIAAGSVAILGCKIPLGLWQSPVQKRNVRPGPPYGPGDWVCPRRPARGLSLDETPRRNPHRPLILHLAGQPEDLASRGPWLAHEDRALGLQQRMHVINRSRGLSTSSDRRARRIPQRLGVLNDAGPAETAGMQAQVPLPRHRLPCRTRRLQCAAPGSRPGAGGRQRGARHRLGGC